MAKKKDDKKGIFCLEGEWRGVKDTTSVKPVLRLLQTMGGYKVPYVHRDIGTREEFDFYVRKWRGRSFASHPILYLGFHGKSGCILVGEGRSNRLELMELADQLEGCCKGRVIHFGSCSTLRVNDHTLNAFLQRTGALAVLGFRKDIDWLESASFDTLVLGYLQGVSFTASGMRKLRRLLEENALVLSKKLEFRMWPARD